MSWLKDISEDLLIHALRISALTYAKHIATRYSIKASMYEVLKDRKIPKRAIWIAKKLLWEHAIKRNKLSSILEPILAGGSIESDKRFILELFADQIVLLGCSRADVSKLANISRRAFGKEWMQSLEPLIGRLFSLKYEISWPSKGSLDALSLEYGHPKWYVEYLINTLGEDETLSLMKFSNEPPITYVLVNTLRASESEIVESIERLGIVLERDKRAPLLYRVKNGRIDRIIEVQRKGLISIQDYSSVLAVLALQPKAGISVLDVCAAPGVKTAILAIYTKNNVSIISLDISTKRFATYVKRMKALNVNCAYPIVCDASIDPPIRTPVDAVLVDPSCSSTGLFWREPSYRWIVKPGMIKRFSKIQSKILNAASKYVKVNGYLLYCTCSITVEENEHVVKDFLSSNPNFKLVRPSVEARKHGLLGLEECIRLYPHTDGCNGFFIALMKRVS